MEKRDFAHQVVCRVKVSKFFKDQKMSIFEKKNQWLLTSNNDDNIWIAMRVDRRYIETKSECLEISI